LIGALFQDIKKFNTVICEINPKEITKERMEEICESMNNMQPQFTKENSPKDFKKTWKYSGIYNWTATCCDYINYYHAVSELNETIKFKEYQKQKFVEEYEIAKLCMEDISAFDVEGMEKELRTIEGFIERVSN